MKAYVVAPIMLFALGAMAQAQAPPMSSSPSFGFSLPTVEGTMTYSLSGSESFLTGYGASGVNEMTAISGSLGYLSSSPNKPFSLVYSGGYLYSSVPGYPPNSTFQNLAASQVWTTKNWNFVADDAVSYMPEAPTTGLSGIPGVGDIGVTPVLIGDEPTESILTNYATRLGNGLNGSATRKINASWSMGATGSWQILHFSGNNGIDSDEGAGSVGPTYRIDARSSASAQVVYTYTKNTFQGLVFPFTTEGVTFQYQRQLSRFLTVNLTGGPQRTYGTGATEAVMPSQITAVGSAGMTYARRTTTANISFARTTNAGSGVVYGALTDTVAGSLQKQFSRNWQGALTASYSKNTALAQVPGFDDNYDAIYGGGQISRRLGRAWSAYFSYTAVTQNATNPNTSQAAFGGLTQVFAVGVTYSPGAMHLGHF
ncbi:MAG: hypothetical protein WBY53_16015 [Acidobacteriaceae bacterium]